ncbi:MAG TPA: hypothetical protein VK994_03680 [Bacteroidales bacterium]|nr:hypothetical protein [Bacteroidales bacterium]
MKILIKYFTGHCPWLLFLLLIACKPAGNTGSGDVLVRVYDKYLYASDLKGLVPQGTSARDSLTMVRTFIQNWVDKELIVRKAEENLPEEKKDFTLKLEEYRNSLIIFEYEKMLVKQELDTVISQKEIREYYENNKGSFVLQDDILSMQYLVMPVDSPQVRILRQYMRTIDQHDKDSLVQNAGRYGATIDLMENKWISKDEMSDLIPLESYSYNDYLASRRFYELRDSDFVYLVNIRDYKPADSLSPLEVVNGKIRKIIINRRKTDLVKNMRQDVLQDAIEKNQVEIF